MREARRRHLVRMPTHPQLARRARATVGRPDEQIGWRGDANGDGASCRTDCHVRGRRGEGRRRSGGAFVEDDGCLGHDFPPLGQHGRCGGGLVSGKHAVGMDGEGAARRRAQHNWWCHPIIRIPQIDRGVLSDRDEGVRL